MKPIEDPTRAVTLVDLRVEYQINPLGIGATHPRLSWRLRSSVRGTIQIAYQIRVATSADRLEHESELVWDSGKITSQQSTQLPYAGPPLQSRKRYTWQVRVWNEGGTASSWSDAAWWEMGLLLDADWHAQWIAPPIDLDPEKSTPAPMLRSRFELSGRVKYARVYVTSLGLYELHLNGERVGDGLFTPGWTSFEKRLQYQVYDVTKLLKEGTNVIGAVLGDGWYRRTWFIVSEHRPRNNGKPLALLVQIEVVYEDGRAQYIVSDADWKTAKGPILLSEIYNGELYDARLEHDGWATASFDDAAWSSVRLVAPTSATLIATLAPPVRKIEELTPIRIFKTPAGVTVADMGQNMVGWVRLRVQGAAGTAVTLRHVEVLDRNGDIYAENLRSAEQKVQYVLKGNGTEIFEPHFTFHGFRYVAIEGYPGLFDRDSVTGIVIHSDLEQTGRLETSNALVNRLQQNILWSLKGNFVDVPTDNPQRDERLGWAFDAQLFSSTAALNMNVATIFTKWLGDLSADQLPDGAVPMEIPRAFWQKFRLNELYALMERDSVDARMIEWIGAPGYGDAATIVPWNLYQAYGDISILRSQYESMMRWVSYIQTQAGEDHIWDPPFCLGDWLDFETTRNSKFFGATADDLIATAFYAHSVDIMQRTAEVLGKAQDAAWCAKLRTNICEAFQKRFVSHEGVVGIGTQTAYVLALDFDLLSEALRPLAASQLAKEVRSRGHLTTGIGGTSRLLNVLSRFGYDELAYMLLNRKEMPSWLYSVTRGATTIWERWDGIRPDGSLKNDRMNSFNQYTLGAIGPWLYGVMAGIATHPASPGYKHILIGPRPGGGMTHVKASHDTPYGEVSTEWQINRGTFHLNITIPPNTSATVTLPHAQLSNVLEGARPVIQSNGILAMKQVDSNALIEIGSGRYEFQYPIAAAKAPARDWG